VANRPHPDKQAVTWRLHRDLVLRVRAAAAANGETVLALVTRALEREVGRHGGDDDADEPCVCHTAFTCLAHEHAADELAEPPR
jgi:hypothetical protein